MWQCLQLSRSVVSSFASCRFVLRVLSCVAKTLEAHRIINISDGSGLTHIYWVDWSSISAELSRPKGRHIYFKFEKIIIRLTVANSEIPIYYYSTPANPN
ncbi:hypothetical protein B0T26DRAFT_486418 [Lasiosphaeria miniovina]|uniref:Uncharacterized protein n=1 Tax=Lasiosphaeria miniovina TaxID=1954250 RepID=A0AA39ZSQ9_9PEZI|nr:uncharacterized protein B0T26DRAFT_486418 [Lasiosphaeria miniovina]KAK0702958.1 hypothetical protein B0T26DRAFT_486418 [Lasiosphaeria miniovina]